MNGDWLSSPSSIKSAIFEHFRNFLGSAPKDKIFALGNLQLNILSEEDKSMLVQDFSLEEVEVALKA